MLNRKPLMTAFAASLIIPSALMAQTDTTARRDSTMRRDTTTMNRSGTMNRGTTRTQPPVTSQQRLRVQKGGEAAGTLDMNAAERARQDSIAAATAAAEARMRDSVANVERMRADSIAAVERARADSIAAVERRRADSLAVIERARQDSIAAEEARRQYLARYRFGGNGWYVGVGAGTSAPNGDFKAIGYNSGLNVQVPIGWHRENSLLGVRMDLGYNRFSGEAFPFRSGGNTVTLGASNPQVFNASLNLTAALPFTPVRNVSLYGVGGAGLYHFRGIGNSALGGYLGNDVLAQNESNQKSTRNKLGASIGGGIDWTVGTSTVYLESRWVNVFSDQDDAVALRDFFGDNRASRLRWVPITVGVKIR